MPDLADVPGEIAAGLLDGKAHQNSLDAIDGEVVGILIVIHHGAAFGDSTCIVGRWIWAEYKMNLNGLNCWYLSISRT